MTPQGHNKTLAVIYGVIGVLALTGLLLLIVQQTNKPQPTQSESLQVVTRAGLYPLLKNIGPYLPILLPPMLQLVTAYGLLMKRRWGRILALVSSAFLFWLFPLGTGLAIYTWWFLLSGSGRRLYLEPSD